MFFLCHAVRRLLLGLAMTAVIPSLVPTGGWSRGGDGVQRRCMSAISTFDLLHHSRTGISFFKYSTYRARIALPS